MRISDWSSDGCASDLSAPAAHHCGARRCSRVEAATRDRHPPTTRETPGFEAYGSAAAVAGTARPGFRPVGPQPRLRRWCVGVGVTRDLRGVDARRPGLHTQADRFVGLFLEAFLKEIGRAHV